MQTTQSHAMSLVRIGGHVKTVTVTNYYFALSGQALDFRRLDNATNATNFLA